jgi:hypothetical protein
MTRTLLAMALAAFAAMSAFTSSAQACISCEYVPPVVNTPVKPYHAKTYTKKRHYQATKPRRTKKHIVKRKAPKQVDTAKTSEPTKKTKTAKTAPVKLDAVNENSTISTAAVDDTGSIEPTETRTEEAKADPAVGCKKFFASVGMTLSVPCE